LEVTNCALQNFLSLWINLFTASRQHNGPFHPPNIAPPLSLADNNSTQNFKEGTILNSTRVRLELNKMQRIMMKKLIRAGMALLWACASLVFIIGCDPDGDENVQPSPVSYVSLYNASPNAPELDIVVDDRQINTYPFEYSDHTGYLTFYTGDRNLKFGPFGASNIVVDTTVTLEDEKTYSIFVVDEFTNASLLILNDNSEAPASGKAKVRFINLSPDGEAVLLRVKGESTSLTEEESFKEATDFFEVDAKTFDFEVISASNSEAKLQIPSVELQEGWFYTILVRGYTTPPAGNTNLLSADVLVN